MRPKIATGIQLTDHSIKWGLVTVANKDGSINRQYVISGKEADAVAAGNAGPPGCTKDEWASGLVEVCGRPCNPGQAVLNPDGNLIVNYGVVVLAGRVTASVMKIFLQEFDYIGGVLHIVSDVAAQVDKPFSAVIPAA